MKKIPSLFCRNYDGDRLVRDEIVPGSEWVAAGADTMDTRPLYAKIAELTKRVEALESKEQ